MKLPSEPVLQFSQMFTALVLQPMIHHTRLHDADAL